MELNRLQKEQISYIHLPDPDNAEESIYLPSYVISETQAYVICDGHLELAVISPTFKPNVFELVSFSNPIFYVGSDEQAVFYDLTTMGFIDFAKKYMHTTFHEKCRRNLIEARWRKQLTVNEVAELLQMPIHDYLRIEYGTSIPSVDAAYSLANLLGTSIEGLFFP
ncbi:hypothetical protein CBW65_08905 [Tumebacillus avium]|uniref:HTH cro/C1-type domain-containing protein n=1 Tax=Tumebacillus avium TaxID=1903704 RepID=A0A1Y0IMS7_9BACL|nr:helix-turn-helix transcriptional regulator [Tumebacillus avium]ARU61136.1 hypothetical protein CBW65_08905 [Tumebacillus avium]